MGRAGNELEMATEKDGKHRRAKDGRTLELHSARDESMKFSEQDFKRLQGIAEEMATASMGGRPAERRNKSQNIRDVLADMESDLSSLKQKLAMLESSLERAQSLGVPGFRADSWNDMSYNGYFGPKSAPIRHVTDDTESDEGQLDEIHPDALVRHSQPNTDTDTETVLPGLSAFTSVEKGLASRINNLSVSVHQPSLKAVTEEKRLTSTAPILQLSNLEEWVNEEGSEDELHRQTSSPVYADYDILFNSDLSRDYFGGKSLIQIAAGDYFVHTDLFRRWKLGKVIGRGASSVVKLAREAHDPRNREVAMKIISKTSEHYKERSVAREIFISRVLMDTGGHENIVNLYEVGESETQVCLVMECLTGGPLQDLFVENVDISEKKVASILVQMLRSLEHCHRLNIVHRDVKPENFVFSTDDDDATLTLTDFGISFYSEDPNALCKTFVGTPLYIAPEILYRENYGPEADLWSVGVIAHYLLRGDYPFRYNDDDNIRTLLDTIRYTPIKFDGPHWLTVSDNAKNFVAELLQKDPKKRLTAEAALQHPFILHSVKQKSSSTSAIQNVRLNIIAFFARKRWKAAIYAVMCLNRMLQENDLQNLRDVKIPDSQRLLREYRATNMSRARLDVPRNRPFAFRRPMISRDISRATESTSNDPPEREPAFFGKVKQGFGGFQKNIIGGTLFRRKKNAPKRSSESQPPRQRRGNQQNANRRSGAQTQGDSQAPDVSERQREQPQEGFRPMETFFKRFNREKSKEKPSTAPS
mmetsp:Transcript_3994/g.11969  ORF Transcript_3994/g.11969 Transcript_3994/m.11969 type:complete len:760 (-) Transcript_3994:940-3219(-)